MTLKKFEDYKILNFSEIGHNWSARFHRNKEKGNFPYTKGPKGILLMVDVKKRNIPRNSIYLNPEQAEKYNEITEEINRLKELQKNILDVKL